MASVNVRMGVGCDISPAASLENVVLGDRVTIRDGAQLKNVVVGSDTRVARDVTLYSSDPERPVRVGSHCWLAFGVFGEATGGEIRIEDYAVLAHRCTLLTSSGPGEQSPLMDALYPVDLGEIRIGPHSWIGAHCVFLPHARLGEGVVIGSCSLVRAGEYEDWTVYGGSPARRLKVLDRERVEALRREQAGALPAGE